MATTSYYYRSVANRKIEELTLTMKSMGLSLNKVPKIPTAQIMVVMIPAAMSIAPPEIIVFPVTKEKSSFS